MQAAHLLGGEMTYKCLSNGQYEIKIDIYKVCGGGANFDSSPDSPTGTVSIFLGNSSTEYTSINLDPPIVTSIPVQVTNLCLIPPPTACGVKGSYVFTVDLPISTESYHIVYQRCCRNSTIANVQNPNLTGTTFSIEISPEAQNVCNSSPVFNNLPQVVLCVGESVNVSLAATDIDGDQLQYEFCAPLAGGSDVLTAPDPDSPPPFDEVTYASGFSSTMPIPGLPPIEINPNTGQVTGIPNIQGQFAVAICVSEYRNGNLLSRVIRDFQFNIAECPSIIEGSLVSDEVGFNLFYVNSCNDFDVRLTNTSIPLDNIINYEWTVVFGPDSTLFSDQKDLDLTFPDYGSYPGRLIVNPGQTCIDTVNFFVNITPEVIADIDIVLDSCARFPVELSNSSVNTQVLWDMGDSTILEGNNVTYTYAQDGLYDLKLTVTDTIGCADSNQINLPWFPLPSDVEILVDPILSGCAPVKVPFETSYILPGGYSSYWDFGDGLVGYGTRTSHVYDSAGVFDVSLIIENFVGCTVNHTVESAVNIRSGTYVPNVFSPNDDGVNDLFCIISNCDLIDPAFTVFNRWGSVLFSTQDLTECWDGSLDGSFLDPGVYIWQLEYTDDNGGSRMLAGDVSLLK